MVQVLKVCCLVDFRFQAKTFHKIRDGEFDDVVASGDSVTSRW